MGLPTYHLPFWCLLIIALWFHILALCPLNFNQLQKPIKHVLFTENTGLYYVDPPILYNHALAFITKAFIIMTKFLLFL